MFRNPESGHDCGRSPGRSTAVTLSGLTSIVESLSASRGSTAFLPLSFAAKASPVSSSRAVAIVADGASMTTSAHASSHTGTTNVRVMTIAICLRYYQPRNGRVHNSTDRSVIDAAGQNARASTVN